MPRTRLVWFALLAAACGEDAGDGPNLCGTGGPGRAAPVTREIGPEGGRLEVTTGPLACTTLYVEPGELMETHRFTLRETFDQGMPVGEFTAEPAGPAVSLEWDGLVANPMDPPALRLTLPFRPEAEDPEQLVLFARGGLSCWLADGFDVDVERGRATFFTSGGPGAFQIGRVDPVCEAPLEACRTDCRDLRTDPHNCGACFHSCSIRTSPEGDIGSSCVAGVCEDWAGEKLAEVEPGCVSLGERFLYFQREGRLRTLALDGSVELDLGAWWFGECPHYLEYGDALFVAENAGALGSVGRYSLAGDGGFMYALPPGFGDRIGGLAAVGDRLFATRRDEGSDLVELDPLGVDAPRVVYDSTGRLEGPVSDGAYLYVDEIDRSGTRLLRIGPDDGATTLVAALEGLGYLFSRGGDVYFVTGGLPCTAEAPRMLHRLAAGAETPTPLFDVGCQTGPILVDDVNAYFPAERDGVYAGLLCRPLAGGDAAPVENSGPVTFFGVDDGSLYGTRPDRYGHVLVRLPQ